MTLVLREIAGWLLLGAGLATFIICYVLILNRRVLDCIPMTFIGYTIFRGGLHLIKVAAAARACSVAAKSVLADKKPRGPAPRAVGPRPTVVPGAK